jgi:hypothetical protein
MVVADVAEAVVPEPSSCVSVSFLAGVLTTHWEVA